MRISDWSSDVCSSDLIADRFGERLRLREHVRQVGGLVGNRVDVEEGGPWDVLQVVFGPRSTAGRRQMMAAVEYPEPGIVGVRSEERGVGNKCVGTCRSRWSRYH